MSQHTHRCLTAAFLVALAVATAAVQWFRGGFGVEKNPAEAFRWWKKAAEQGLAEAQCEPELSRTTRRPVSIF